MKQTICQNLRIVILGNGLDVWFSRNPVLTEEIASWTTGYLKCLDYKDTYNFWSSYSSITNFGNSVLSGLFRQKMEDVRLGRTGFAVRGVSKRSVLFWFSALF